MSKSMGAIGNGDLSNIGISILGIGMISGLHAAISPSVFTFTCFARKPEEKAIARKTLFISLGATSLTSIGLLLVFKQWIPAIVSEVTALGLFGLGMYAIECNDVAPAQPTMAPAATVPLMGIGHIQPEILKVVGWPRVHREAA